MCDSDSKFDAGDEVGKGLEAEFTVEAKSYSGRGRFQFVSVGATVLDN